MNAATARWPAGVPVMAVRVTGFVVVAPPSGDAVGRTAGEAAVEGDGPGVGVNDAGGLVGTALSRAEAQGVSSGVPHREGRSFCWPCAAVRSARSSRAVAPRPSPSSKARPSEIARYRRRFGLRAGPWPDNPIGPAKPIELLWREVGRRLRTGLLRVPCHRSLSVRRAAHPEGDWCADHQPCRLPGASVKSGSKMVKVVTSMRQVPIVSGTSAPLQLYSDKPDMHTQSGCN